MKKAGLLVFILLTAYIGGIYENPALMALAVAELLLAAAMCALTVYMSGCLELEFPAARTVAVKGQTVSYPFIVRNRSFLPVGRFAVRVESGYEGGGPGGKKKIYGGAMPGESLLGMEEKADRCGICMFRADQLQVYDYLSLFSRKTRLDRTWETVVLPPALEMKVCFDESGAGQGEDPGRQSQVPGSAYGEIRRIREYRPGDLQRHIHWNQTARSGQLWVKEYEEEQERRAVLCLDVTERAGDMFWLLLSALLSGLLRVCGSVSVFWYDQGEERGEGRCLKWELSGESGRPALFDRLYRTRWPGESRIEQVRAAARAQGAGGSLAETELLTLDQDLALYRERRLVYRFSSERLEEELTQMTVRI